MYSLFLVHVLLAVTLAANGIPLGDVPVDATPTVTNTLAARSDWDTVKTWLGDHQEELKNAGIDAAQLAATVAETVKRDGIDTASLTESDLHNLITRNWFSNAASDVKDAARIGVEVYSVARPIHSAVAPIVQDMMGDDGAAPATPSTPITAAPPADTVVARSEQDLNDLTARKDSLSAFKNRLKNKEGAIKTAAEKDLAGRSEWFEDAVDGAKDAYRIGSEVYSVARPIYSAAKPLMGDIQSLMNNNNAAPAAPAAPTPVAADPAANTLAARSEGDLDDLTARGLTWSGVEDWVKDHQSELEEAGEGAASIAAIALKRDVVEKDLRELIARSTLEELEDFYTEAKPWIEKAKPVYEAAKPLISDVIGNNAPMATAEAAAVPSGTA